MVWITQLYIWIPYLCIFLLQFSTTFNMEYKFEEVQNLQFVVYDVDDKHHVDNIDKQQLLGTMECTLAEIMAAGVHLTKSLKLQGADLRYLLNILDSYIYISLLVTALHTVRSSYFLFHFLCFSRQACWYNHYPLWGGSEFQFYCGLSTECHQTWQERCVWKGQFWCGAYKDWINCCDPFVFLFKMQSDPYIEIAKVQERGEFTLVYRSQPIMKTLSPK